MNTDEALRAAIEILKKYKCKFWLMAGACLGAVRDNRFLNVDIDIGYFPHDPELWDHFIEDFTALGFELFMEWKDGDLKVALALRSREGEEVLSKLDLFPYYMNGEHCWHGLFGCDKNGNWGEDKIFYPCVFESRLFSDLKEIEFRGIKCLVPNPPEEYLESWYGRDWRTPTRDWLSWRDCQAINFGAWKWLNE